MVTNTIDVTVQSWSPERAAEIRDAIRELEMSSRIVGRGDLGHKSAQEQGFDRARQRTDRARLYRLIGLTEEEE